MYFPPLQLDSAESRGAAGSAEGVGSPGERVGELVSAPVDGVGEGSVSGLEQSIDFASTREQELNSSFGLSGQEDALN